MGSHRIAVVGRGAQLADARLRAGFSQPALAKRAGVNTSAVKNVEAGRSVRPETAHYICGALNADFEDLFEIRVNESSVR